MKGKKEQFIILFDNREFKKIFTRLLNIEIGMTNFAE